MSNPRRKRSESDAPVDREPTSGADTSSGEQSQSPDEEQIRARAYELYRERGGGPSDQMEDWLRAEREYRERGQQGGSTEGDETPSPPPA